MIYMRGRKPGKYYQYILDDVLVLVSNCPGTSIKEVADKCNIGWSTARRYLEKLEGDVKLIHREKGKVKVYQPLVREMGDREEK